MVDRLVAKAATNAAPVRLGRDGPAPRPGRLSLHDLEGEDRADHVQRAPLACDHCGISFPELTPQLFSFNSPLGMCPECNGLGTRLEMDPELVVPDPDLSIHEGAVKPLAARDARRGRCVGKRHRAPRSRETFGIDLDKPWKKPARPSSEVLLFGTGDERVKVAIARRLERQARLPHALGGRAQRS